MGDEIYDAWNSLLALSGCLVTYTSGANSCTITVVPARGQLTVEPGTISPTYYQSAQRTDFLCLAEDLDFGSGATLPVLGDTITFEKPNGVSTTYQVVNAPGEMHYRFADEPYRRCLRIHTAEA